MILFKLLFVVSFVGTLWFGGVQKEVAPELQPKVAPPEELKYFTFGFDEVVADSFWLRVIQNFDFCEENQNKTDSAIVHVATAGFTERVDISRCRRAWVYQMLDFITELSPKFFMAYLMGGSVLSVAVDDVEGASLLYAKGIKNFPNNWLLLYRAAYHELYERGNVSQAAIFLTRAGKNGAPIWVHNLAAKLYEKTGQIDLGRIALIELIRVSEDQPKLREKAIKRLEKLNKMLEK